MRPQSRGAKICFNLFCGRFVAQMEKLIPTLASLNTSPAENIGTSKKFHRWKWNFVVDFLYESQSSKKFGDDCYNHKKCLSFAVTARQGNTSNSIICLRFGCQRMVSHNTQIIGGNWFIGRVTSMKRARLLEIFPEKRVQPLQPSKIFYEGTVTIRSRATVSALSSFYVFFSAQEKRRCCLALGH